MDGQSRRVPTRVVDVAAVPTTTLGGRTGPRRSIGTTLRRLAFLLPAGLALLAGLDAALVLLGVPAPVTVARLPQVHGMLLVLGFVGTLIALERAVALSHPAALTAPALLGAGAVLLLSPAPLVLGKAAMVAGAFALMVAYVPLYRRQYDEAVLIQAVGATLAAGAALMWLGGADVGLVLPWLTGFVVLTIGGERLELARVALSESAGQRFVWLTAVIGLGAVAALLWPMGGYPMFGFALLALVGWLVVHDTPRRTIRSTGLVRFMAGCLLGGYVWLAVAGAIWLLYGAATDGSAYDAVVHAVFLGFTLSMIMAHAPVILPAVLRIPLPYHPAMLAPAALLHGSLALRLAVGDARGIEWALQFGGVLNIVAVLGFVAVAVWSAVRAQLATRSPGTSS